MRNLGLASGGRVALAAAIGLLASALAAPTRGPAALNRFSGAFIQYWNNMVWDEGTRLKPDDWAKVLDDMKDIGMTTVINQHLGWKTDGGEPTFFIRDSEDDATEVILDLADFRSTCPLAPQSSHSPRDVDPRRECLTRRRRPHVVNVDHSLRRVVVHPYRIVFRLV